MQVVTIPSETALAVPRLYAGYSASFLHDPAQLAGLVVRRLPKVAAIFGRSAKAETPSATAQPSSTTAPPPSGSTTGAGSVPPARTAASPSASIATSRTTQQATVDIKAVLRDLAKSKKQKLNYDKSIVDLLKLLGLESSADARKQLAAELGYSGDTKKSAKMNVWLHKQVMIKLAANGGKVPQKWME